MKKVQLVDPLIHFSQLDFHCDIVILVSAKILESDNFSGTALKARPSRSQNVKIFSNRQSGTGLMNYLKSAEIFNVVRFVVFLFGFSF